MQNHALKVNFHVFPLPFHNIHFMYKNIRFMIILLNLFKLDMTILDEIMKNII